MGRSKGLFLKGEHVCQLQEEPWDTDENGRKYGMFQGMIKKCTLVSEKSAICSLCYRTQAAIILEKKRQIRLKHFIIHPFSNFRAGWEIWMILIYFISFLFIPFEACNIFYSHINSELFINYGIPLVALHAIFIVDMVLNFMTGYIEENRKNVILDRKEVALRYLKSYFILDILSTAPALMNAIPLYFGNGEAVFERVIILNLIKIYRLGTYTKYCKKFIMRWGVHGISFRIFKFLIRSIFFYHWAACLLFILPFTFTRKAITAFSANTWIHTIQSNIQHMSIGRFYLSSLFTAINLTLSCAAMKRPEHLDDFFVSALFAVLAIMYNCFLFIHLLDIFRSIMEPETKYDEFITQLRDYMRHNQLPSNIQQRMYLFYERRYQRVYFREEAIMNTLSDRMCNDITDYGRQKMLEKSKILSKLEPDIISNLLKHFTLKVFVPKDNIVKARSLGRHIYFISSGTVVIYTISGREVTHLYDGDYFGELSLLMKDHKFISNVTALEICEIYTLDRDLFLHAMATKPFVFEQVIETAKQRIKETRAVEAAGKSSFEQEAFAQPSDILLM